MTPSDRCRAEIAAHEQALRSGVLVHDPATCKGDPHEMQGVLQALQDWAEELREIDRMMLRSTYRTTTVGQLTDMSPADRRAWIEANKDRLQGGSNRPRLQP